VNETLQARPVWQNLANKAQDELELLQRESTKTRIQINLLRSSLVRLESMHAGYGQQLNALGTSSLGMRQAMTQRQFMSQLLTLMERVKVDIQHAQNQLEAFEERRALVERERLKMQSLADKNAEDLRRQASVKDQRRMDELAVLQFNRREAS
jgi:flagellar export protein FliJ